MTSATFNLENLGLTITFPRSIIRGRFSSLETYAIWQAQSFLKHGRCEDGCVAVLNVAEGITDADKRGERAGEMDDQIIERLIAEDTARHKTPTMPITGSAPPASAPVDSEWPKYLVGFDAQGDRTIFVYRSDDNGVTFYRDGEFKAAHWNYAHNLHRTDMRVADTAEAMRVATAFKAGSAEHGMGVVVDTPKWLVSWLRKYAPAIEAKTPDKPAPYAPQGHSSKPECPWVSQDRFDEHFDDVEYNLNVLEARISALEGKGAWRGWIEDGGRVWVSDGRSVYCSAYGSWMTQPNWTAQRIPNSATELHGPELAALVREFEAWRDSKPELP